MSQIEAQHICANVDTFPLRLVSMAEALLAASTGAEAIPVGEIAVRDQWFIDG
jgi:hypothetical protein